MVLKINWDLTPIKGDPVDRAARGFLARKGDGESGVKSIWLGLQGVAVFVVLEWSDLHLRTLQGWQVLHFTFESALVLVGKSTFENYLQAYSEVDVILDTFPFTGGTTTCEALWMGVPTLTLIGQTMISRQGGSMLHAAGLDDWVVDTVQEYERQAIKKVKNLET